MTAPFAAALDTDAHYVSPAHLRTPFRSFLVSYDKGIYWLRMPAGTGKTEFVRGIVARRPGKDGTPEGIDSAISSGTRTIAVGLAPGAGRAGLVTALAAACEAEFGVPSPDAGAAASDPAAFAQWLAALKAVAFSKEARRLLVCIDALEAGEDGPDGSVVDLLPGFAQLPSDVVMLLTSRPAEDWPAERFAAAEAKFAPGAGVGVHELGLSDPAYVDALHKYYQDSLRPLVRARANALLLSLLETRATYERGGRDPRLTKDPVLRDALKDDWKKLTNKFPRYSGQQLPVDPLTPILDQFDQLWVDMLANSEGRARYIFLMVRRLADGSLKVEDVAGLPRGKELDAQLAEAS
ncbi:hypothetical protein ABLE93_07785 [Xanthobacter sp. KR7-65]|uniref:hypothetical protein n=1 Tax=Xanthobacter sp. KR7-65 TaxID=3156612 RepID=UPI0032B4BD09